MVCAHGQLSRQCELCEAMNTIAELTATVERLRDEVHVANNSYATLAGEHEALRQQLAAAQADAGRLERLNDFVKELAEEDCGYGDDCPEFGSRHYRCLRCKALSAMQKPQP